MVDWNWIVALLLVAGGWIVVADLVGADPDEADVPSRRPRTELENRRVDRMPPASSPLNARPRR